ncbi:MAG TPA: O-antigen ligase family protein, partial [Solirubrobacteraceae bacterium]
YPTGYPNASAAQWLMAFWPALLLARSGRLPWVLRGLLAGGAVLLAEVALLSQSRGSLYATPVMLVLVFALLPGRVRTFALLVPVAAGIGAAAPAILRVGERIEAGQGAASGQGAAAAAQTTSAIHTATAATFLTALVVGLLVAVAAAVERRRAPLPQATAVRVHRGVGALALICLLVLCVGGWVAVGDPVARARHAWTTFKSPSGYNANAGGDRLTGGLGSNRYDFYRVALDEFTAHPLLGIGADNFAEPYLAHGRSGETPHYPHSVELRTLSQTGLVGALLALVGLAGALVAGWRAVSRSPEPLARALAAAALAGFAYWVVHGSFDWFWEFAGLGAPAFALLGLACALAPRVGIVLATSAGPGAGEEGGGEGLAVGEPAARTRTHARARGGVFAIGLAAGLLGLAAIASFTAPWLSQLQVQSAGRIWVGAPAHAYALLDDAARLNPLFDEPQLVAGSIALRRAELRRADSEFARALQRAPGDAYATLERGAIASTQGRPHVALALLRRAAELNPRDPLTRDALALVRRGRRVDVAALNRSILSNARQFS